MNFRRLFSFLILLLTGTLVMGQSHYGFKGGVNFSKVDFADGPETDFRTSYNLGVFAQYPLSESVFIEPEIILSGKGYHYNTTVLGTNVERESRPLYLEIPVLLHFHKDMGPGGLYANVGPYISNGLTGTYYRETALSTDEGEITYGTDDGDDEYRKLDLGIQVGGGFWVDPGFSLTIFYDHGLYNVSPSENPGDAAYNRTIGLSLGFVVE